MKKKLKYNEKVSRSIITKFRKDIWRLFTKAISDYKLVSDNDHIMVCISGGKDSFLLAKCMEELALHGPCKIKVSYVCMNPGYNDENISLIKENARKLNLPLEVFSTNIFESSNALNEKSPCYLCARMRRGALYSKAKAMGCNKIALGHHFNDVIETTLLSIFYAGEVQTMLPKLHSDNYEGIELIRPLYLVREKAIIAWAKDHELCFLNCACKFLENSNLDELDSKRKEIKDLIAELKKINIDVDKNIFASMSNINLNCVLGTKKDGKYKSFLDDYNKKEKNEKVSKKS